MIGRDLFEAGPASPAESVMLSSPAAQACTIANATQARVDLVSGSRRSSSRELKSHPKAYWTTSAVAEDYSHFKPPPFVHYLPARTTRRNFMLAIRRAGALCSAGSWAPSRAARPVFRLMVLAQLGPWLFKQSMMHHGYGGQEALLLSRIGPWDGE